LGSLEPEEGYAGPVEARLRFGSAGVRRRAIGGFVNQTQHSDAELWTIWKAAQENLAHEVDLNPLQRSISGAPADIRPGDAGALKVMPH